MNDKQVAQELVKFAKALVSGCEKLPEGPMRDNCEKKKKEKGDKDEKRKAAQSLDRHAKTFRRMAKSYESSGKHLALLLNNLAGQLERANAEDLFTVNDAVDSASDVAQRMDDTVDQIKIDKLRLAKLQDGLYDWLEEVGDL